MFKKLVLTLALAAALATPAFAQPRVEITPFIGGTFGGAIDVELDEAGYTASAIEVGNSATFGAIFGFNLNENVGVEFLWSYQPTNLSASITAPGISQTAEIDATMQQYHGNFVYTFLTEGDTVRPFFLLGFGASRLSSGDLGDSITKFSFGLGGGVKIFPSEKVGVRAQFRWNPTYITDEPAIWCDYWGFCYVVGDPNYMQQTEASVGVIFRF